MEKVTLYIPCYNAHKYIKECLDAILVQTYPIDEIIVIDDEPTDETALIASDYPVTIIRPQQRQGLAAARNVAFRQARNEFVASLDADCAPQPDWLEKLMQNFTNENIAGVGGKLIERYTDRLPDRWRAVHMKQHWGEERIVNPPFLLGSNNVYRKKAIKAVGYYDEKYKDAYEDVDLCKRLREGGYNLIYEPRAVANHLMKDSLYTLLERAWRWRYAGRINIISLRALAGEVMGALMGSRSKMRNDFRGRNYLLLAIDLLYGIFNVAMAIRLYLRNIRKHR